MWNHKDGFRKLFQHIDHAIVDFSVDIVGNFILIVALGVPRLCMAAHHIPNA